MKVLIYLQEVLPLRKLISKFCSNATQIIDINGWYFMLHILSNKAMAPRCSFFVISRQVSVDVLVTVSITTISSVVNSRFCQIYDDININ